MNNEPAYETHDSYGLLQISRITCGPTTLFGSSIKHNNTVRLRISGASIKRDLSSDWFHDHTQLIEVEMSATQFAEAITTLNCGVGTPCTLLRVAGVAMPPCPDKSVREQIRDEFAATVRNAVSHLDEGMKQVQELLSKKTVSVADRQEILEKLRRMKQDLVLNIPFVHEQFDEAMDKTVLEAKGEIEAFYTNAVVKAGKGVLYGACPELPVALEDKREVCEDE